MIIIEIIMDKMSIKTQDIQKKVLELVKSMRTNKFLTIVLSVLRIFVLSAQYMVKCEIYRDSSGT